MRKLTKGEVAIAQSTALQPFNKPTEVVPVPTDEEMQNWYPDPDPTKIRWRTEHNVSTGEVTHYELTLEEYRARHVAKIKSRNQYVERKRAEKAKADRDAAMQRMLDQFIANEAKGK